MHYHFPRLALLLTVVASSTEAQNVNRVTTGVAYGSVVRAPAPAPKMRYFAAGDWYLSPRVWLGGVDGGAIAYGVSLEKALGDPKNVEDGLWAIGIDFDYYKYRVADVVDVKVIPIGAVLNYHFALDNARIDPYIGAGLGYYSVTASSGGYSGRASTVFFQSQLGARYFLTDALAVGAHVGFGIGTLALSATFRF